MLQAAKAEAVLAVDLYNRSSERRSLEAFVVHMHTAWQLMLQASLLRDGVDIRVRKPDGRHFEKVGGEPKTWSLRRCLREAIPEADHPARRNVEFFIGLRNRIEHQYAELVATVVAGKTQALVMNFEEQLVTRFGEAEGLADELRFPVFLSSLTPEAAEALKRVHKRLPKRVERYIREHDEAMPAEVAGDWRYDFRVYLLPQTGPRTASDVVMRFIREEDMTPEQRQARDVVQTIVRDKQVPVQNHGKHKPGQVARLVAQELGVRFTVSDHTRAWQHFEVRPRKGADRPHLTDQRYCVWDEPHRDYLYTRAWVAKLVEELGNPFVFAKVTGRKVPKPLTRAA